MSNLQHYYTQFLSLLHDIEPLDHFLGQIRKPKFSDKERIALSLAAKASGIDSELNLFIRLLIQVRHKIEPSVYNKRWRNYAKSFAGFAARIIAKITPKNKRMTIIRKMVRL